MRECLFLFSAWDNFVLDKIRAKSSLARRRREGEGKMIPRYRRHKTFKVQICMLQPVPPPSWSSLPDIRLSRPLVVHPRHRDCQIRKLSLIPAILNVRFFFLFLSFSLILAYTRNLTPSEGSQNFRQPRARISRAVTASLCENSFWSFRGFRA